MKRAILIIILAVMSIMIMSCGEDSNPASPTNGTIRVDTLYLTDTINIHHYFTSTDTLWKMTRQTAYVAGQYWMDFYMRDSATINPASIVSYSAYDGGATTAIWRGGTSYEVRGYLYIDGGQSERWIAFITYNGNLFGDEIYESHWSLDSIDIVL